MTISMIKLIAFDFGGVLYTWDKSKLLKDLSKELNIKPGSVDNAWGKYITLFEKGKISKKKFWTRFLKFLNINHSHYKLNQVVLKQFKPINKNIALLKKLKQKYSVALLSNHTDWIDDLEKKYHFKKWFDTLVISKEQHCSKPDQKIFKLLIKKSNFKPKEIVFIDDYIDYQDDVKKAGLHFIAYTNHKTLLNKFNKLGIKTKIL